MLLSIIIINYNVKAFLEQCLFSVEKSIESAGWNHHAHSQQQEVEIIVIDNQSTDNSKAYLETKFKSVHFIWKNNNPGFGKSNNEGLAIAKGSLVLFLNPDTLLQEDTLQYCTQWMKQHPETGAVGVKMLDGSGFFLPESKRGFPTPLAAFFKLSGLVRLFPQHKHIAAYYLGHLSHHQNQEVEALAGAFLMMRKPLAMALGGFDERFFMYAEDIDLSYRIQQAGYKNYYLSETRIIHFKGESTASGSLNYVTLFYRAMQQFVWKHYSGAGNWWFRTLLLGAIWSSALLAFFKGIFTKKTKAGAFIPQNPGVVGTDKDISMVRSILKKYHSEGKGIEKINPETALVNLPETMDGIVLCSSTLRYEQMIDHCILYGNHLPVFIHHSNSNSIINSGTKNHQGNCLYI